jgi:hypothetical protein
MGKVKKYNSGGTFDWSSFLSGVNPSGGGTDRFGKPIPGMIPGGGGIAGAAGIVGGVADLFGSKNEIKRQEGFRDDAIAGAAKARKSLEDEQMTISQAQRDLATAGIRPTDLSPMQAIQATEIGALASDPRALMGGIGASSQRAQQNTMMAQQADLGRELGAMGKLADLEQGALDANTINQRALFQGDYDRNLSDKATALSNIETARQQKRDAWGNIIGGVANVGIAAATGGFGGGGGGDALKNLTGKSSGGSYEMGVPSMTDNQTPYSTQTGLQGGFGLQAHEGENYQSLQEQMAGGFGLNPIQRRLLRGFQEGGKVKYQEGGQIPEELLQQIMAENQGREEQPMEEEQPIVQKTEGEFDHDTNKKAIVDEETGEKEGEATGGEYILNPEQGDAIKSQYETIVQMIDNGDEPTLEELQNLFDAVHEVFGQPQFNEA